MSTATFMLNLPHHGELWVVDPPMAYGEDQSTEYVIASAITFPVTETYLFPADAAGKPLSSEELRPGSLSGVASPEAAFKAAGYEEVVRS